MLVVTGYRAICDSIRHNVFVREGGLRGTDDEYMGV